MSACSSPQRSEDSSFKDELIMACFSGVAYKPSTYTTCACEPSLQARQDLTKEEYMKNDLPIIEHQSMHKVWDIDTAQYVYVLESYNKNDKLVDTRTGDTLWALLIKKNTLLEVNKWILSNPGTDLELWLNQQYLEIDKELGELKDE